MLELSEVSRTAGKGPVLVRASVSVASGAPLAILGLPVAARIALVRLLEGADSPDAGAVRLDGKLVKDVRRERGAISTVDGKGVELSGKPARKVLEAAMKRGRGDVGKLIALAGIGRPDTAVKQLPLDQRVRLDLACAIAGRPALLLLDAPAAGLSGEARGAFLGDLAGMVNGLPHVVLIAAEADEARAPGGQVMVLDRGRVVQLGSTDEVFGHPRNLVVAMATSSPALNLIAFELSDGSGLLADGSRFHPPPDLAMPAGGSCTIAFRPDDVTLARRDAGCIRFAVRTLGEETTGGRRFARVGFGGAVWLAPAPETAVGEGLIVSAFIDRTRVMVFDAEGQAVG